MEQLRYPSPSRASAREASGHVFNNGNAPEGTTAHDPVHQLQQQLAEERLGGIHIDPNLQPHSNHAQQLAQNAIESLTQPYNPSSAQDGSNSPAVQNVVAAAAAAAAVNRSKTSRACDECRRKKIRCDGSSEMEMGACSACKRSGLPCAYSRTPQKRGPNRGYIRELTQRVELLERERHDGTSPVPSQNISFLNSADMTSTPPVGYVQASLKRPLEDDNSTVQRTGVPPEAREGLLLQDPQLMANYFTHIHPFLPILPPTSEEINILIRGAGAATTTAFMQALALSQHDPLYLGIASQGHTLAVRQALDGFNSCRYDDPHNLLQVHTGLLLLVDSFNRGASTMLSRAEPNPWMILKEVMAVAINNQVFEAGMNATSTDETGARRLSLTISVLDAFMFNANKKYGMVAQAFEFMTTPRPEDRVVFGRRLFELNRISRVVRQVLDIDVEETAIKDPQPPNGSSFGFQAPVTFTAQDIFYLRKMKRAYADTLTSVVLTYNYNEDPLVAMVFWYARLLIEVHFYPLAQGASLIHSIRCIMEFFEHETSVNFLTHHISGFTAHVLFQLIEFNELKDECIPLLETLGDTLNRIVPAHDTDSFDAAIKDVVTRKRQALGQSSSNLAQLADVAVSNRDETAADHGVAEAAAAAAQAALSGSEFSGARLSKDGYITALLGGV